MFESLYILGAHLLGDFVLQNHWMQKKCQSSFVCTVHVAVYSLPWTYLAAVGIISWYAFLAVIVQHWVQDRFSIHRSWMRLFRQTPPKLWPVGPLCMDQAWHIAWIALVLLSGI